MAYSMLYRYMRRLSMPREKKHRLYNRYFWWLARRVDKGTYYDNHINWEKHRKNVLNIRKYNRAAAET